MARVSFLIDIDSLSAAAAAVIVLLLAEESDPETTGDATEAEQQEQGDTGQDTDDDTCNRSGAQIAASASTAAADHIGIGGLGRDGSSRCR